MNEIAIAPIELFNDERHLKTGALVGNLDDGSDIGHHCRDDKHLVRVTPVAPFERVAQSLLNQVVQIGRKMVASGAGVVPLKLDRQVGPPFVRHSSGVKLWTS